MGRAAVWVLLRCRIAGCCAGRAGSFAELFVLDVPWCRRDAGQKQSRGGHAGCCSGAESQSLAVAGMLAPFVGSSWVSRLGKFL